MFVVNALYFAVVLVVCPVNGVNLNEVHGCCEQLTVWIAVCAHYESTEVENGSVSAPLPAVNTVHD